ncbi:amidohydrolase family protein [Undibacterium sp. Di24W]|uniref:amidohydrolase family protein n=1 Tax=Undibacterium sp. Di24W TaxID=3413033 RepID=UPI003BF5CA35
MMFSEFIVSPRFLVVSSLLMSLLSPTAQADSLLIKQVRIINSVSDGQAKISKVSDVLIRDGKIQAIAPNLSRHASKATAQIDGRGRFLIPGLIDSHVHLDGVPGYAGDDSKDAAMLQEARAQMPRSYAYFGFTTVLDLTGDAGFIAKWNAQPAGPQAHFCTPVTIPNGYPASWMDKDLQFQVPATKYMLFDPAQPNVYPANFKTDDHTPQAVVNAAKQDGANCIKVFYETGFGPKKNLPVPSVALIQEVVKQAKHLKMPVYLHGNSQASYEFALKAGVTTLVHGMWHEAKNVEQFANQTRLKQIADEIAQAGISVQPTMQVLYGEHEELNPDFFKNPMVAQAIPQRLMAWYQTDAGQWMKNILAEDFEPATKTPAELYQSVKTMYQKPLSTVRRMTAELHQQGAKMLFGSDTPSGPFYTQFPGINGRWEMDRWLEAGMSLPELFSALTMKNARALGLEKTIGSVEVGKQADLLLLTTNPLLDVRAYDTIEQVILRGKAHQRAVLSAQSH